jgi:putative DNA methylase
MAEVFAECRRMLKHDKEKSATNSTIFLVCRPRPEQ